MSLKKTLLLGVILAALVLYLNKVQLPQDEAESKKAQIFSAVKREELATVEVKNSQGTFLLKNSAPKASAVGDKKEELDPAWDKHWEIDGLSGSGVDTGALTTLLNSILDLNLDKPLAAEDRESDLSVYGLDKPLVTLKVGASGKTFELNFGKNNEYVSKRYVSLSGAPDIYLVSDTLFAQASKGRDEFRDHSPVNFVDSELASFEIKDFNGANSFKVEQSELGKWQVSAPFKGLANTAAVNGYTMKLRNLSATGFIDNQQTELKKYGLDKPKLSATLNFKDQKRASITVALGEVSGEAKTAGAKGGENKAPAETYLFVDGAPTIYKIGYKVGAETIGSLSQDLSGLREKKLFQFAGSEASQVEINQAGTVTTLTKAAEKWSVNGKEGDFAFVEAYLDKLSNLEAKSFPSESKNFGFDTPQMKVLVRLSERGGSEQGKTERSRVLVVGGVAKSEAGKPSEYFAGVDDLSQSNTFTISAESLAQITPKEESLVTPVATAAPLLSPTVAAAK